MLKYHLTVMLDMNDTIVKIETNIKTIVFNPNDVIGKLVFCF